jgi:broad specificity phosphatase PhoE
MLVSKSFLLSKRRANAASLTDSMTSLPPSEHAMTTHGEDVRAFRFPGGESAEDVNGRMGVSLRRYVLPRLEALRSGQEKEVPQIIIVAHGVAIAEVRRKSWRGRTGKDQTC